jgi:membrane fusion protein, multidrug efflux system
MTQHTQAAESLVLIDNIVQPQFKQQRTRKLAFGLFALVLLLIALGVTAYWFWIASRYVTTDNAYSSVEMAAVSPAIDGTVQTVTVVDTQSVKAGDILVILDDTDARLALDQARAELGQAERRVRSYYANGEGLAAQVASREAAQRQVAAQLTVAHADLDRATLDYQRRQALANSGSVSGEELSNARTLLATAKANLAAAEAAQAQSKADRLSVISSKKANAAQTEHTTVEDHPEVALARAKFERARIDLQRTIIRAPSDGVIARRQVQLGQRVNIGATLMSIVPLHDMHVDANLKEGELQRVQIGQPVEVVADRYGHEVVYHGVVSGLSGGTGSAFAMIPAQNATGNWIKVVQRLPVRITLNPEDLVEMPLQVGLSMQVKIDTAPKAATSHVTAMNPTH